jgi:hypothetical protein
LSVAKKTLPISKPTGKANQNKKAFKKKQTALRRGLTQLIAGLMTGVGRKVPRP